MASRSPGVFRTLNSDSESVSIEKQERIILAASRNQRAADLSVASNEDSRLECDPTSQTRLASESLSANPRLDSGLSQASPANSELSQLIASMADLVASVSRNREHNQRCFAQLLAKERGASNDYDPLENSMSGFGMSRFPRLDQQAVPLEPASFLEYEPDDVHVELSQFSSIPFTYGGLRGAAAFLSRAQKRLRALNDPDFLNKMCCNDRFDWRMPVELRNLWRERQRRLKICDIEPSVFDLNVAATGTAPVVFRGADHLIS